MWERGNPTEADVWIGLKFHWMLEKIDFVKELREEISGKFIHLMPNEFLRGYEFGNVSPKEELLRLTNREKPTFLATGNKSIEFSDSQDFLADNNLSFGYINLMIWLRTDPGGIGKYCQCTITYAGSSNLVVFNPLNYIFFEKDAFPSNFM